MPGALVTSMLNLFGVFVSLISTFSACNDPLDVKIISTLSPFFK